jgi:hypothetical protein
MDRDNGAKRRWPVVALAIAYALTGLLHLAAALIMVFVFGGKSTLASQPDLLPVYGRLGAAGYVIFFLTLPLDAIAFAYLLRRIGWGRGAVVAAAVMNLPLVPFGTITGAGTLALLWSEHRTSAR